LNLKGTPSQEGHKTIFTGFKIYDKIDFPAIFRLREMTYGNLTNSGIRQFAVTFAL
jgi:hypothetical protein